MPCDVFEESIELIIELLEAEAPNPRQPLPCHPLPGLSLTGQMEARRFRLLVLENPFLRVSVLPDLGGRIFGMFDKRQGVDILPAPKALKAVRAGIRGVELQHGIQLRLDRRFDRRNSMGFVNTQLEHPDDEDQSASMWFGETEAGTGVSLTCRYVLSPHRAELILEVRAFNRGFKAVRYDPSVIASVDGDALLEGTVGGVLAYERQRDCGLALWPKAEPMDSASFQTGHLCLNRFAQGLDKQLGPRQLDVWQVGIQPLSGLTEVTGASPEIVFSSRNALKIRSTEQRLNHKLLILTADEKTLEAGVELYPERVGEIALPHEVKGLVLQDAGKVEVFRYANPLEPLTRWSAVVAEAHPPAELPRHLPDRALQRASFEPALKHQAHLFLGMNLLAAKDFARAALEFESALLYNAEDHLTWWVKAIALRLSGDESEERSDLLNAHFLAPLEPALRAEGFLSQPQTVERDPSPLLRPLEDDPESFIEIACLLVDCGLWEESARWIDEALRHCELQMLHYLLAYCHLKGSGMAFEAARHVQAAADKPLSPPYPWRPIELVCLKALAETFPDEARLNEISVLANVIVPEPGREF